MDADSILLHIKDSYYFEVPKWMWAANYQEKGEFPDVWVKLDPNFQLWQAKQVHQKIAETAGVPSQNAFLHDYQHWTHLPGNHGKPVVRYLTQLNQEVDDAGQPSHAWAAEAIDATAEFTVADYKSDESIQWGENKIAGYNHALSGKILIPQPAAELRNLYQAESGFAISKFMIIELFVALIMFILFTAYARHIAGGKLPRTKFWHLVDAFIVFLRNDVAKANIHHHADKFMPVLWTIFFFVLGCNLFGLVPWMGSPTGAISVTVTLAAAVLFVAMGAGASEFGALGVWLNLIPGMELPTVISVIIKPMMFVIEVMGLLIKHAVLGVRLLANMVAGHVVLLAVMGLALETQALGIAYFAPIGTIVLAGSVLLSCLELFVAFLQAYVFVLLAALFINAATHAH